MSGKPSPVDVSEVALPIRYEWTDVGDGEGTLDYWFVDDDGEPLGYGQILALVNGPVSESPTLSLDCEAYRAEYGDVYLMGTNTGLLTLLAQVMPERYHLQLRAWPLEEGERETA